MLEVALLTALVIAVLTVPPVTKPVLPSVTVPVPNFSLHLEASSVEILEASLLAFALNLESNPLLMLEVALLTALVIAVLTVPPVTKPVLLSVTVPVPKAACQAVLLIEPSLPSATFHNWLPVIPSLEFSATEPSVTLISFLVAVEEPIDTTLSSVAVLSLPRTIALFALVVTLEPNTNVFAPIVWAVLASPMVLLLPNA